MTDTVLVTGGAGFIGSHVVDALLARGTRVVCIDNFNDYYDPTLKRARAARHLVSKNYRLVEADIRDRQLMNSVLQQVKPRVLIHLAACAGVRPSIEDPFRYHDVNVTGTLNLLHAWPMKGPFDVIFCRNVMIYFDQSTREKLVSRFADMLAPGGYLCIGHSESIHAGTAPFKLVGKTIYRRNGGA